MEAAHGLFMAEGEKVIRRAIAAGYGVRSMLVTPDRLAGLADVAGACGGPGCVISPAGAPRATRYRGPPGAVASMNPPAPPPPAAAHRRRGPAPLPRQPPTPR